MGNCIIFRFRKRQVSIPTIEPYSNAIFKHSKSQDIPLDEYMYDSRSLSSHNLSSISLNNEKEISITSFLEYPE